jgi:hypothetical protein
MPFDYFNKKKYPKAGINYYSKIAIGNEEHRYSEGTAFARAHNEEHNILRRTAFG